MYSFSSSPRRRFVLQTEISGKKILFLLFILYLNSVSYSTPWRSDQLTVYFNIYTLRSRRDVMTLYKIMNQELKEETAWLIDSN